MYPILDCHYLLTTMNLSQNNVSTTTIESFIADSCYCVSLCFLYSALLVRVYIAFKQDKKHALSSKEITITISVICIFFIHFVVSDLIIINQDMTHRALIDYKFPLWISVVLSSIGGVLDIIISGLLLYLFLKRLYKMISQLDESYQNLIVDEPDGKYIDINININDKTISNVEINHNSGINNINTYAESSTSQATSSNQSVTHNQMRERVRRIAMEQIEIVELMTKISLLTILWELALQTWVIVCGVFGVIMAQRKDGNSPKSDCLGSKFIIVLMAIRGIGACTNCCFVCHICLQ